MAKRGLIVVLSVGCLGLANAAIAGDDDVAPLVVDNGSAMEVAEPGTLGLLGAGLAALAWRRSQRRER